VGTGVILAGIVFYLLALAIGYFMSVGTEKEIKNVMALGTGQRNLSAAFVVAAANFTDRPDVIITLIILVIVDLVLLLPLAGEIGKRVGAAEGEAEGEAA
jgi:BASS family bile acid:Na+ symporter